LRAFVRNDWDGGMDAGTGVRVLVAGPRTPARRSGPPIARLQPTHRWIQGRSSRARPLGGALPDPGHAVIEADDLAALVDAEGARGEQSVRVIDRGEGVSLQQETVRPA
jgi:hypothetical protein